MQTLIALFRGINVGGKHLLPMKELKLELEALGLARIKSYIQSGNVVFQSEETDLEKLASSIKDAIARSHGFAPEIFLLSVQDLQKAVDANPYPEREAEPKTLHFSFLSDKPSNPDFDWLEEARTEREDFELIGRVFYLFAPEGIGRSRLAAGVENALGVSLTARNLRTVSKILEMSRELSD